MRIHIHAPSGYYLGQVRAAYAKRWRTVTGKCKSDTAAMAKAVKAMDFCHKRARVIFCAELYEPNVVMELSR